MIDIHTYTFEVTLITPNIHMLVSSNLLPFYLWPLDRHASDPTCFLTPFPHRPPFLLSPVFLHLKNPKIPSINKIHTKSMQNHTPENEIRKCPFLTVSFPTKTQILNHLTTRLVFSGRAAKRTSRRGASGIGIGGLGD